MSEQITTKKMKVDGKGDLISQYYDSELDDFVPYTPISKEEIESINEKLTILLNQADKYKEHRIAYHTDPKPTDNIGINETLVAMDTGDTWYWDGVEWKVILNG